jgi:acetate kinase
MRPTTEIGDTRTILALNSGSSSLKFGLYHVGSLKAEMLMSGEAEAIGEAGAKFHAIDSSGDILTSETTPIGSQEDAVGRIGKFLVDGKFPMASAVGHRVVHGGPNLLRHCVIDDDVLSQLKEAIPFAPLHIPSALAVIRFARTNFPNRPQIACFDTSFHADLPEVASTLPVPKTLRSEGIRRYGFHGLSCESIVHQLAGNLPGRLIVAHLGNGASVTAIRNGKSIDTSMGLTPTGGVIMGTRTGDLDPGILLYLIREKKLDAEELEDLVDHQSGLLGISNLSSDMRRLHQAASSNVDARLAIEMFCYSVRKQIAAMIAALGGIDMVVFTGGIGENDEVARAMICEGLSWIGIGQAETRSWTGRDRIPDSKVCVLPSEEDEQIARHTWSLQNAPAGLSALSF